MVRETTGWNEGSPLFSKRGLGVLEWPQYTGKMAIFSIAKIERCWPFYFSIPCFYKRNIATKAVTVEVFLLGFACRSCRGGAAVPIGFVSYYRKIAGWLLGFEEERISNLDGLKSPGLKYK